MPFSQPGRDEPVTDSRTTGQVHLAALARRGVLEPDQYDRARSVVDSFASLVVDTVAVLNSDPRPAARYAWR